MGDVTLRLKEIARTIDEKNLARVALAAFKENTPVLTGYARSNTVLTNDGVHARYGYAALLDAGKSRKAPDGMSKPAIEAVMDYIKKELQ